MEFPLKANTVDQQAFCSHQLTSWVFKQCTLNSSQPCTNSNNDVYWKHHIVVQQSLKDILNKLTITERSQKVCGEEGRVVWSKKLNVAQLLTKKLNVAQCDNMIKTKFLC